jgi:outer membrane protein
MKKLCLNAGGMMRKRLLYVVIVLFSLRSGMAFAESEKIGFVNAQKVFEISKEGKKFQESMDEYAMTRQNLISLEEKELKQLDEEFSRQGSLLSPEAKRVKQAEFQRKVVEFQKKAREFSQEVQEKRFESLNKFNKILEVAVKAVAKKEGYFMILDNKAGGAVIFSSESNDITPQVIEKLGGKANK